MFSLKTYVTCQINTQKRTLPVVLVIMMLTSVLTGAMYDSRRKEITINTYDAFSGVNSTREVTTRQGTVSELFGELGYEPAATDRVSAAPDALLSDGGSITVRKGRQITLVCDGGSANVVTTYKKTADVLAEAGVVLGAEDITVPALNEEIDVNEPVEVIRVTREEARSTHAVAFAEEVVYDGEMYEDEKTVVQEGAEGESELVESVVYHNGEEFARETVAVNVIAEPQSRIVKVGTKKRVNTHSKGFTYKKKLTVTATAYDPYPAGGSGRGITANGMKAQFGVVAVDPKVIPLGIRLYIESTDGSSWSYGYCIAADTGGAIKGNKIDLCYNTVSECIQFGRRSANVYILG